MAKQDCHPMASISQTTCLSRSASRLTHPASVRLCPRCSGSNPQILFSPLAASSPDLFMIAPRTVPSLGIHPSPCGLSSCRFKCCLWFMAQQLPKHISGMLYGTGVMLTLKPQRKQTVLIYAWLFFFFFIPQHNSDFNVPSTPHQYLFTASEWKQKVNISFPILSLLKGFA